MINTQTPIKNSVSKRPHILRLLGVNLSLAVLLCLQAGSVRTSATNTAWLVQRTPAMTQALRAAAEAESSSSSTLVVTLDDTPLTIPYLEEISASSIVSTPRLRPAAPAKELSPESSKSSKSSKSSETSKSSDISASASSATAESTTIPAFPAFNHAVSPVSHTPNWGAMKTPAQWNRSFGQMTEKDFVQIPAYDLRTLMTPLTLLAKKRDDPETIRMITAKLYYSTRYFGAYDLDSGEYSAVHPGIDLKLAAATPVGAVAGGRVHDVRRDEQSLGVHVIIEHRAPDDRTYYSIYGHLDEALVAKGDTVLPGSIIGTVGMTGNTSGPHLHLQIDVGEQDEIYHTAYWPGAIPGSNEASERSINPVTFIRMFANEE